jgi:hypothetical protein
MWGDLEIEINEWILHAEFPLYVTKQFMLAAEQSNNFDPRYCLNLNVERE